MAASPTRASPDLLDSNPPKWKWRSKKFCPLPLPQPRSARRGKAMLSLEMPDSQKTSKKAKCKSSTAKVYNFSIAKESNNMNLRHRGRWLLPLIALLAGSSLAASPEKPFTIEQVMSAPFPTRLGGGAQRAARSPGCSTRRGVRNIWVAEPPDYKARRRDLLHRGRRAGDRRTRLDARRPRHRLCARG